MFVWLASVLARVVLTECLLDSGMSESAFDRSLELADIFVTELISGSATTAQVVCNVEW